MNERNDIDIFIGLEIHVQLNSPRKLFCACSTAFGDEPNTHVCPICLGYPGVLPALNEDAMRKAYTVARALDCTLATESAFARKNYFYPDLPKNYQISQFAAPLGRDGTIELDEGARRGRIARIGEVHLEEDAGKMIHSGDVSLLDFNRTGTPLLEIVTKPDLRDAREAELLLLRMRQIVRYLRVSDGNMEEGSLRCDANISIAPAAAKVALPDYKVEIKNMNSSRFVRLALEYEIERQRKMLLNGETPRQETRLWNENRDLTVAMRSKEESMDYRYFPEPDLPTFVASEKFLTHIERQLVELPHRRARRIERQYDLSIENARMLCADKQSVDYFERCVADGAPPQLVYSWLLGEVRKQLHRKNMTIDRSPITAARLVQLLRILDSGEIHGKIAKQTLQAVITEDKDPQQIIDQRGWRVVRGDQLQRLVAQVLNAHPQAVAKVKQGEDKSIGFLIGQVMKQSDGQADPQETSTRIRATIHTP